MGNTDTNGSAGNPPARRAVLKRLAGAATAPFGIGASAYGLDRSYRDADGDGIPDSLEQSAEFNDWIHSIYGDQFSGLDPTRRDLLVDVRYVGERSVSDATRELLVDRFRANGIHLQWLEHPQRHDRATFERQYGYNAKRILWSPRSFYRQTIESRLKNIAFQLIVVPGFADGPNERKLYSPSTATHSSESTGYVNGLNAGNRAVVASRYSHEIEAKLILHEIAHYALCHSSDPTNTGVMGTNEEIDLMAHEWAKLRSGLGAIRDTTGVDVLFRRCLWAELNPLAFRPPSGLIGQVDCPGCQADTDDA